MALADLKCELSWSASRAKEFERCRREYWYARYASWAWWKEKPPGERFEIMLHKNLYSLPAFAGDCVHRAVERWFHLRESGASMTAQDLFEQARDYFRAGWRQSSSEDWKKRPNKSIHLEEHHYQMEISKETTEKYRQLLEKCAQQFFNLPELEKVRSSDPESWLAVEGLDTYVFLGTKIYAVPDFAMEEDGQYHIYDWKTGRPREEDLFQLHTYALYACEKWAADPESIHLHAVYLGEGQVKSMPIQIDKLSEVQDRMSESVRAMMDLHYDPERDPLVQEHWPVSGAPQACRRCRFRGICDGAPANL